MSEPDYIAYFEKLASQHKAIRHSATHKAFYVVHDDNYAELETAVRNTLELPALLLDQYFDEEDTASDNNRLRVLGGLSVICKIEAGDTVSVRTARDQARQIARSFLNRLRKDCRYNGTLYDQNILVSTSARGEATGIVGGGSASGWGYSFDLLLPTTIAVAADDWSDL